MQQFKKFDVLTIAEGERTPKEQNGLQASSEQELRSLLAMTGEKILEIRRVYEGDVVRNSTTNPEYLSAPDKIPPEALGVQHAPVNMQMTRDTQVQQDHSVQIQKTQDVVRQIVPRRPEKTKIYKIGDVEIKEQGGIIYQKQWVRISSSDYRLVNDSNNKILPMTGKHIEVLKWVVVDSSEEDQMCSNPHNDGELVCG